MATPQPSAEELQRQEASLKRIEEYYRKIGYSTTTVRQMMEAVRADQTAITAELGKAEDYFDRMAFSTRDLASTFSNVLEDLKGSNIQANKGVAAFKQLNTIAEDLARHQEGINKLDAKELENLQKKFTKNKDILFSTIEQIKGKEEQTELEKRLLAEFEKATESAEGRLQLEEILGKKINDELETEKNITKELNVRGALLKGTIGIMDKLGLSAFTQVMNFEKANEELRKEYETSKDLKKAFGAATNELFNGLKHALNDPATSLAVWGAIGKAAFTSLKNDITNFVHQIAEINKESATLGRSLGTSNTHAHHMVENAKALGRDMKDVTFTGKDYAKAMAGTAESLGLQVNLGSKTYHELAKMTEMMGLSADEATQIYKLGTLNNKELAETNASIAAGIISAQKQYGIQVNSRQVFQSIGKLSAATLANFKQNPEALAKAVVQAKALGSDLDKMDAAAQSLLNFESSIQNELEAELLTGKQINLENARAAALNNDQVGYMNAIAEETGNLAEFNKKNRLQQEALAKAFGMSRADLASMLQDQEVYNKLGDISGKTAEEQLAIARERGLSEQDSLVVSLQQQASAEKLQKTFEGLKETIAGMLEGPFGKFVKWLAEALNSTLGMSVLIGIMASSGLIKLVAGFTALAKLAKIIKLQEIGTAIAKAWQAAFSGPASWLSGGVVGAIVGGGLVAAIMASMSSAKADDMYSGYGDRTLITPKGSYALNNNDTVIAGTNLFRGNDVYSGPMDSINLTGGIESKLDNLANAIRNQPVMVKATVGPSQILDLTTAQTQYGAPALFA